MAEARERGWSSVESNRARSHLTTRGSNWGWMSAPRDLFTAELPEGHFNAVVMGDVLEHLTRAGEALDRAASLLAPEGVLVLLLPDAGSRVARILGRRWWSVIPTHIHYFTRHSARTMLDRHGFDTVAVATDPKAFTVGYYIDKGSGYLPRVSRSIHRAADRLGFADRMWVPDFRDRMIVIARRRPAAGSPSQ